MKTKKEEVARWSYLPTAALNETSIAWHLSNSPNKEYPKGKYKKHSWRKADVSWVDTYDSLQHHLTDFIEGQDYDLETKRKTLSHAMCRLLMLLEMQLKGTGIDDRYK